MIFGKEDIGTDDEMTQVMHHDPGANPPRPVDPPLSPDPNPDDSDDSDNSDDLEPAPEPGPVPTEPQLPFLLPSRYRPQFPIRPMYPAEPGTRPRAAVQGAFPPLHQRLRIRLSRRPHRFSRRRHGRGLRRRPFPHHGYANIHAYTSAHAYTWVISRSIH